MGAMIPTAASDLTAAWLRAALREAPAFAGVAVRDLRCTRIGEGFGLDGRVYRLTVDPPPAPPGFPLVVKLSDARGGTDEMAFYRCAAGRITARVPRFVAGEADATRAFLLLEDIAPAEQGDVLTGTTPERAEAVIRAMAGYHAVFRGGEGLDLAAWEPDPTRGPRIRERAPRFLERYGEELRELVDGLAERVTDAEARLARARPTLVHGDLHLDNVLFPPEGGPVILDWTRARRGAAALDVAAFLVEGLVPAQRPWLQETLLEAYARAAGEDLRDEVRAALVRRLGMAVLWAGAEEPGFKHPRVPAIVDSLVRNALSAVRAAG